MNAPEAIATSSSGARGDACVILPDGEREPILFDMTAAIGEPGCLTLDALNLKTGSSTRYRLDANAQRFLISQLEQSLTIQTYITKAARKPASLWSRIIGRE